MALLGTLQVRLGLDTGIFNSHFNKFVGSLEKRVAKFQKGLVGLTELHALMGAAVADFATKTPPMALFPSKPRQITFHLPRAWRWRGGTA